MGLEILIAIALYLTIENGGKPVIIKIYDKLAAKIRCDSTYIFIWAKKLYLNSSFAIVYCDNFIMFCLIICTTRSIHHIKLIFCYYF